MASEGQITEEKFSPLNFRDTPYNGDSSEALDRVRVKYALPKGAFMSKTVKKMGLIWVNGGFLLQLFTTQM